MVRRKILIGTASLVAAACLAFAKPQPEQLVKNLSNHFVHVAHADKELVPLLKKDNEGLRKRIADALGKLNHLTPKNYVSDYPEISVWEKPTASQLSELTTVQLVKIHYMLKALEDPEFRKRMQNELELDTADKTGEHGGVFCLRSGKITVQMLPHVDRGNPYDYEVGSWRYDPDANYSPDSVPVTKDLMGMFHFHARELTVRQSAFSSTDFFVTGSWLGFTESFLFSRPTSFAFNVDMMLILVEDNGTKIKKKIDLDLGVYTK